MWQGLSSSEDGILLIKTKPKQTTKITHGGKTLLAGWAGKGRAGQDQDKTRKHMTTNWHRTTNTKRIKAASSDGRDLAPSSPPTSELPTPWLQKDRER